MKTAKKFQLFFIMLAVMMSLSAVAAQECVDIKTVTFERDKTGSTLVEGQIIDYEYNDGRTYDFKISASNAGDGPDDVLVLNTEDPIDEDFKTPGEGSGNDEALYKVLVIAENGIDSDSDSLVDVVRSEPEGGKIIIEFANKVMIDEVVLLDVDESGGRMFNLDENDDVIETTDLVNAGDNNVQTAVPVMDEGKEYATKTLEIEFKGTAALASISYCEDVPPECGDGFVNQDFEECDDGNTNDGDGCSDLCKLEAVPDESECGNNDCQIFENAVTCPEDCDPVCGNMVIEPGEDCDGNCYFGCDGCECDISYTECVWVCTEEDECDEDSDCSSNEFCADTCMCETKLSYCDVDKGSECDATDSSSCSGYESCDLGSCTCEWDGECHPDLDSIFPDHECSEDSDCGSGEICSDCECVESSYCGDGIIDSPNDYGIYEECEIGEMDECNEGEFCGSSCQCQEIYCADPVDIMFFMDPSESMSDEAEYFCEAMGTITEIIDSHETGFNYKIMLLGPLYSNLDSAISHGPDGSAACSKSGGDIPEELTKVYDIFKDCDNFDYTMYNVDVSYAACESWGHAINDSLEDDFWREESIKMIFVLSDEDASAGNDADSCVDDNRCVGNAISYECYLADNVCNVDEDIDSWCERSCAGDYDDNNYFGKRLSMGYGGTGDYRLVLDANGYYGTEDWNIIREITDARKGINIYTMFDSMETVMEEGGKQILKTGIMGSCAEDCILFHQDYLTTTTGGAVLKIDSIRDVELTILSEIQRQCSGGCPAGTTLCQDGTCSYDCEETDDGNQGCLNNNGICDYGEGCACEDCIGEQDSCAEGAICGTDEMCGCPAGTTLCNDGTCDEDCDDNWGKAGCIGEPNDVCDYGEGCACIDCDGEQDSCVEGSQCSYEFEICVDDEGCPEGTTLCADGTCDETCEDNGGMAGCIGEPNGACNYMEGCACIDCDGERDSCRAGLVCNYEEKICERKTEDSDWNPACVDNDGDGYYRTASGCEGSNDCDDSDYMVNQGAEEICNTIDDDCDGDVDEGCGDVVILEDHELELNIHADEKLPVLEKVRLKASVKNNAEESLDSLILRLDTPPGIKIKTDTMKVSDLPSGSIAEVEYELIILEHVSETARFVLQAKAGNSNILEKSFNVGLLIPEFKLVPEPSFDAYVKKNGEVCMNFYYAINDDRFNGRRSDVELNIVDPSLVFGQTVLVDYVSGIREESIVSPLIDEDYTYCLPTGKSYVVKGYLYNPVINAKYVLSEERLNT